MKKFFTKEEAEAKVGKDVMAKYALIDIPAGIVGRVDSALLTVSGYCIMISWQGCDSDMAMSKDQYEELLTEIPKV
jgi:hypothetical protein